MNILSYEPPHGQITYPSFWLNDRFHDYNDDSFILPFSGYDKSYLIEILRYK